MPSLPHSLTATATQRPSNLPPRSIVLLLTLLLFAVLFEITAKIISSSSIDLGRTDDVPGGGASKASIGRQWQ